MGVFSLPSFRDVVNKRREAIDDAVKWSKTRSSRADGFVQSLHDLVHREFDDLDRTPEGQAFRDDILNYLNTVRGTLSKQVQRPSSERCVKLYLGGDLENFSEERKMLHETVFPRIIEFCRSLDVTVTICDLRVGYESDPEKVNHPEFLDTALREVHGSYYIGLVPPSRYGWQPRSLPPGYARRYPPVHTKDSVGLPSVFDCEVTQGLLNSGNPKTRAWFYLRSETAAENALNTSPEGVGPGLDWMRSDLQRRIEESGYPVRPHYSSSANVCELLLEDITRAIADDFRLPASADPNGDGPAQNTLLSDMLDFIAENSSRLVGESRAMAVMAKALLAPATTNVPHIITGDAGCGKTALVATLADQFLSMQDERGCFVFFHKVSELFPETYSSSNMLRRFLIELKEYFNLTPAVPEDGQECIESFYAWLRLALSSAKARDGTSPQILLFIDDADLVRQSATAAPFLWVPSQLPEGCKCVMTTSVSESEKLVASRRWPVTVLEPLRVVDQLSMIRGRLAEEGWGESFPTVDVEKNLRTTTPRFISTMLDQLAGDEYRTVPEVVAYINQCLACEDDVDFYKHILEVAAARVTSRVGGHRDVGRGLFDHALKMMVVSRGGLTEQELEELCRGHFVCTNLEWTHVLQGIRTFFSKHSGALIIQVPALRKAMRERLSLTDSVGSVKELRLEMCDYFATAKTVGERRLLSELPWLLWHTDKYEVLKQLLCNVPVFLNLTAPEHRSMLLQLWQVVGKRYDRVLPQPVRHTLLRSLQQFQPSSTTRDTLVATTPRTEAKSAPWHSPRAVDSPRKERTSRLQVLMQRSSGSKPPPLALLKMPESPRTSRVAIPEVTLNKRVLQLGRTATRPLSAAALRLDGSYRAITPLPIKLTKLVDENRQLMVQAYVRIGKFFKDLGDAHASLEFCRDGLTALTTAMKWSFLKSSGDADDGESDGSDHDESGGESDEEGSEGKGAPESAGIVDPETLIAFDSYLELQRLLAEQLEAVGKMNEGIKCREKIITALKKMATLGRNDSAVVESALLEEAKEYASLAQMYTESRVYSKGEQLFSRALNGLDLLGSKDAQVMIRTLFSLSKCHSAAGDLDKATEVLARAMAVSKEQLSLHHPLSQQVIAEYAGVLTKRGETASALDLWNEAVRIAKQMYGTEHPKYAYPVNELGHVLLVDGQTKEAEDMLVCALSVREAALGPDHVDVAISLANLATLYSPSKPDVSDKYLGRALAIAEQRLQYTDMAYRRILAAYLNHSLSRAKYSTALSLLRSTRKLLESKLGARSPGHIHICHFAGTLALRYGDPTEAVSIFETLLSAIDPSYRGADSDKGSDSDSGGEGDAVDTGNAGSDSDNDRDEDEGEGEGRSSDAVRLTKGHCRCLLALAHLACGQYSKADQSFELALDEASRGTFEYAFYQAQLGVSQAQGGLKWEDAIESFEHALDILRPAMDAIETHTAPSAASSTKAAPTGDDGSGDAADLGDDRSEGSDEGPADLQSVYATLGTPPPILFDDLQSYIQVLLDNQPAGSKDPASAVRDLLSAVQRYYGDLMIKVEEFDKAYEAHNSSSSRQSASLPDAHPSCLAASVGVAESLLGMNKASDAVWQATQVVNTFKSFSPGQAKVREYQAIAMRAYTVLASAQGSLKQFSNAHDSYLEALRLVEAMRPKNKVQQLLWADATNRLYTHKLKWHGYSLDVERHIKAAFDVIEKVQKEGLYLARAQYALGETYAAADRYRLAEKFVGRALAQYNEIFSNYENVNVLSRGAELYTRVSRKAKRQRARPGDESESD